VGSVIKKRRKRMAKKKHRKLLRKTRVQRRNKTSRANGRAAVWTEERGSEERAPERGGKTAG